ncbi:hypothetical protein Nepgr_018728 [Nepenthes gracilis]|uniref:Uncharacterized protein n=1 Tax=Nepenthes gracilis TaxID=150966 RepID=A0AAD3XTD3_NEPGR|nr:hypothetical protein Nepgr_018728 [Nepenthes gracilis]
MYPSTHGGNLMVIHCAREFIDVLCYLDGKMSSVKPMMGRVGIPRMCKRGGLLCRVGAEDDAAGLGLWSSLCRALWCPL